MTKSFTYKMDQLIGASESRAIAIAQGHTLSRCTLRLFMHNYLNSKGVYQIPCVSVGVAKVPMTTKAALLKFLSQYKPETV